MIIKFKDKKVLGHLLDKEKLVKEGRQISMDLQIVEVKIEKAKNQERKYTAKIEPKELIEEGNKLSNLMEETAKKLEEIIKKVHETKIAGIPQHVKDATKALISIRDEKVADRNKIALKVQKIKDRVNPMIQKAVKPYLAKLDEFEDIETAKIEGEEVVINTFNWVEDFKNARRKVKK